MKVLVIPDVHLKPAMFEEASGLMENKIADCAVCLMDIPDDWGKQYQLELYGQTFDAAIGFAKKYPNSRWCFGNHDISYIIGQEESGYSAMAAGLVRQKLHRLQEELAGDNPVRYIHIIDQVLFLHGGLSDSFVRSHVKTRLYHNPGAVTEALNALPPQELWDGQSPLWLRPQIYPVRLYKPRKLLQVVGHTPVKEITRQGNVISCDTFCIRRDGVRYGSFEYLLLDTCTWEYRGVPSKVL